jgi:cytochrome c553
MTRESRLLGRIIVLSLVGAAGTACSSSNSSGANPASAGSALTSCPTQTLEVVFSPIYSAYESTHTYQVPAVVKGVAASAVKWGTSEPSMVDFSPDPATGGTMITIQKAGTAQIVASAGNLCGSSTLTVSAATPEQWAAGEKRYNNGVVLDVSMTPPSSATPSAMQATAACTNCHGPTASNVFKTVSHTPEQTGGFSDDELRNIFRNATLPAGGYFDSNVVPLQFWQMFHKWTMTDEEAQGIIVYLRALTPEAQTGSLNFAGRFDGGVPPGAPPGADAGTD